MKKNELVSTYSAPLFGAPVPIERKPSRKTKLLVRLASDSGEFVISEICVEDVMNQSIPIDFNEVTLESLVSKGVDSRALDMIDTSKLGVDEGIDRLALELISNSSKYVNKIVSEPLNKIVSEPSK